LYSEKIVLKRRKKILFGAVDIGWRIEHYSKFIAENYSHELEAESLVYYKVPEQHFKTSYTFEYNLKDKNIFLNYSIRLFFFIKAIFRYDIFHFLSGETILPRKARSFEFLVYKLLGKRLIMHFVGSDIRSKKYLEWKGENIEKYLHNGLKEFPISELHQLKLIKDSLKYSYCILVSTPDLLEIIPSAIYFPALLDNLPHIDRKEETNTKKIIILHSPSGTKTKGSKYIYNCLDTLKLEYPDIVKIVIPTAKDYYYALTRYKLLEEMNKADIVIDQMIIGWYGLKSVEALALGCEVICYIDDDLKKYMFDDTPIIVANVNNLYQELKRLVEFRLTKTDKTKNLEWVNKYHSIESNNQILKNIWIKF